MKTNQSKLRVSLIIFDLDCDPDKLTEILGVTPTNIERKGDRSPSGVPKIESSNAWELKSSLVNESELGTHVLDLISKVNHLKDIRKASNHWEVKISCCVEIYGDDKTLILSLSKECIQKMALAQCSIDFDYYIYDEDH